jgi:protein gp37
MAARAAHDFLILTKRAERMREYVCGPSSSSANGCAVPAEMPLPNVWLGVSIENRRFVAPRRPAARDAGGRALHQRRAAARPAVATKVRRGIYRGRDDRGGPTTRDWPTATIGDELDLDGIDWLIVGGESGHGHRPIRPEWVARPARRRAARGHRVLLQAVGRPTPKAGGRELDGRTWDELPARATAGQEVPAHA